MNLIYYFPSLPTHPYREYSYIKESVLVAQKFLNKPNIFIIGNNNQKITGTTFVPLEEVSNGVFKTFNERYPIFHNQDVSLEKHKLLRWAASLNLMEGADLLEASVISADTWLLRSLPPIRSNFQLVFEPNKERLDAGNFPKTYTNIVQIPSEEKFAKVLEYWYTLLEEFSKSFSESTLGRWFAQRNDLQNNFSDKILWGLAIKEFPTLFDNLQTGEGLWNTNLSDPQGMKKIYLNELGFFLKDDFGNLRTANSLHFDRNLKTIVADRYQHLIINAAKSARKLENLKTQNGSWQNI